MGSLTMQLRSVDDDQRTAVAFVAPYDQVSYLVPDPAGERMMRGAFARSIQHRGDKVPLLRGHGQDRKVGTSSRFVEETAGLVGEFRIVTGPHGDELLEDFSHGCLDSFSVGFQPLKVTVGRDGVKEIREARLVEVSVVAVPAYEGAGLLAVRQAQDLDVLLAPFRTAPPEVNLSPLPPLVYRR